MSLIKGRIQFDIRGHSQAYAGRFKPEPDACLPTIRNFPLNDLEVGESFYMKRNECPAEWFVLIRERVRRCNATKAAWFICEWIDKRQTLEVARIG